MENSISDKAIRIVLIQTLPGRELLVQEALKATLDKYKKSKKVEKYVFFKGLGTFDIILVYITPDFEADLSKIDKPVQGILKANTLLCYAYKMRDPDSLYKILDDSDFVGFSLLKINPNLQNPIPHSIESRLRKYISDRGKEFSYIGSIGWNEITLVVAGEDINKIVGDLLSMSSLYSQEGLKIAVLTKTLSFVGINYHRMPSEYVMKKGFESIEQHLKKVAFFNSATIAPGNHAAIPTIEVSTEPKHTNEIKTFF